MNRFTPEHPIKLKYADLNRMGLVGTRTHLKELIARGTIRPPHKDGTSRQAAAWWFYDEVMEDLERERGKLSFRQRPMKTGSMS